MKIRMDMDYDGKAKGEEVEVDGAEGSRLIGMGVCSVIELDKPKRNEKKGKFVVPPKDKED